ncbi:YceI family protein [Saccharothrix deserti]|uniref:YceI family protein n=1 Tax=Saccharothrix deserti TaxID=2593674 RepID=UPI00131CA722|nr:YceI family protein [Saccharothrix deserti]
MPSTIRRHWKRWLITGAVLVAAVTVGPYVYINFIQEPAPAALTLDAPGSSAEVPAGGSSGSAVQADIDGAWRVTSGSQAGYRVDEVLFGQNVTAVGRTEQVTGDLAIAGASVVSGTFTVDMASVRSDRDQRDSQFRGGIMNTEQYPTATFALTGPVDLGSTPEVGQQVTARATGDLTIRGRTNSVTFDLTAQRTADGFRVNGSIPVTFADYGVDAPNFGGIAVEDAGTIEFLLAFGRAQ